MSKRRGHGEGSIYRAGGRYVGALELGWHNGKRQRKVVYAKTRREVVEKLDQLKEQRRSHTLTLTDRQRLETFLRKWLDEVQAPRVRPRTLEAYEWAVAHIDSEIGDVRLHVLGPQHVHQLLDAKRRAGLSDRSVEQIWQVLKRALKTAVKWGIVRVNVADSVDPPRPCHRQVEVFTAEEVQSILGVADHHRLGAGFSLAVLVGLRRGELLGLRWDDLDLDGPAPTLRVRQQLQRVGGQLTSSAPKSERSRRTIVLPRVGVILLKSHRARQAQERLANGDRWNDDGLVFTTTTGSPIDPRNAARQWHKLLDDAGVARRPLHHARHTAASVLLSAGVPLKIVSETLGHSTVTLTADRYGHLLPADSDRVAEALDGIYASG